MAKREKRGEKREERISFLCILFPMHPLSYASSFLFPMHPLSYASSLSLFTIHSPLCPSAPLPPITPAPSGGAIENTI